MIGSVDKESGVWLLLPAPQMRHVVGAAANRSRGMSVQKPVPRQRSGPASWRSISHAARDGGVHRQPVRGERKQEMAGDGGFGAREHRRAPRWRGGKRRRQGRWPVRRDAERRSGPKDGLRACESTPFSERRCNDRR
eukprot:scaffold12838_cov144-Isochrysis_galbana.AAC.1